MIAHPGITGLAPAPAAFPRARTLIFVKFAGPLLSASRPFRAWYRDLRHLVGSWITRPYSRALFGCSAVGDDAAIVCRRRSNPHAY